MATPQLGAILLAGGEAKRDLAEAAGSPMKALADINGKPMAAYVLDALQRAETVSRILVVCDDVVRDALGLDWSMWVPPGAGAVDNILAGAEALGDEVERLLVASCDTPLIDGPMVDRFVRSCLDAEAVLCYAVLSQASCSGPYEHVRKTWCRLREGNLAGGNVAVCTRGFLLDNQEQIRQGWALRKRPWVLARQVGVTTLFGVILGQYLPIRVPLDALTVRVGRLLGCTAKAIVLADPELGIDVDEAADLAFVRRLVGPGGSRS